MNEIMSTLFPSHASVLLFALAAGILYPRAGFFAAAIALVLGTQPEKVSYFLQVLGAS